MNNKDFWRIVITFIVVLYCIMPDLFPGPIDDIIVILIGQLAKKQVTTSNA